MDRWEMIYFYRGADIHSRYPHMLKYHEDRMLQSTCKPYSYEYSRKNQEWPEIFEISPVIFHKRKMLQRCFTILLKRWTYQKMKIPSIRNAILNYKLFRKMDELPLYSEVRGSSAGIQGWLGAGPHKL
jgi:predicted amidophosphoribosyltransferase